MTWTAYNGTKSMSSRPFPITPPGLRFVSWGLLEGTPSGPGAACSPGLRCSGLMVGSSRGHGKASQVWGLLRRWDSCSCSPARLLHAMVSSNPQTAPCQAEHITSLLELLKGLQGRPDASTCRHVAHREGWGWCEARSDSAEAVALSPAGATGPAVSWGWLQVPSLASGGFSLHCRSPISVPTTVPC